MQNCISFRPKNPDPPPPSRAQLKAGRPFRRQEGEVNERMQCMLSYSLLYSLSPQVAALDLYFQVMRVEESPLGHCTCPGEKTRYCHQGFPTKLLGQITLHDRLTLFMYSQLLVSFFVPYRTCEQITKNYHTCKGSI